MQDSNPLDTDGVPFFGPMADFVSKQVAEVVKANILRMKNEGILDIKGDKERVLAARKQAIAEWNAAVEANHSPNQMAAMPFRRKHEG